VIAIGAVEVDGISIVLEIITSLLEAGAEEMKRELWTTLFTSELE
jgi:hypothetical protein